MKKIRYFPLRGEVSPVISQFGPKNTVLRPFQCVQPSGKCLIFSIFPLTLPYALTFSNCLLQVDTVRPLHQILYEKNFLKRPACHFFRFVASKRWPSAHLEFCRRIHGGAGSTAHLVTLYIMIRHGIKSFIMQCVAI